jgi:hypothetical protein
MPVKIELSSEEMIRSVPVPQQTSTYSVVSHGDIINKVTTELQKAGFTINKSMYRATITGQIAQGIYHLDYKSDPDLGLMFAWSNSYDKTQKFKCAIGSFVFVCGNGMMEGNLGTAVRKHTGTAQDDAFQFIEEQISQAAAFYDELVEQKEKMKQITISRSTQAGIIGKLFADLEILTLSQLAVVKREMDKPSYNYNAHPDSVWCLYNHVTAALKESHPTTWLDDHSKLHRFINAEFSLSVNRKGQLVFNTPEPEPVIEEPVVEPLGEEVEVIQPQAEVEYVPTAGVLFL